MRQIPLSKTVISVKKKKGRQQEVKLSAFNNGTIID